jgi:hypothetical protein
MIGVVLAAEGSASPNELRRGDLPGAQAGDSGITLPGLIVCDVRGGLDWEADAGPAPRLGGHDDRGANRAFGAFTVSWQLARARAGIEALLGEALPPLTVRIGEHDGTPGWRAWSGGHYRLPARRYRMPERADIATTGEIHLGRGKRWLRVPWGRLWGAPAYNRGIVAHEFGHHVVRHTADLRCNARLAPACQSYGKVALDEGTADYLAAIQLGTPDIYGWHRAHEPRHGRMRRDLDAGWTMSAFVGGHGADRHADGQIWAGALWAARAAVIERTGVPGVFDTLVLDMLRRLGRVGDDLPIQEARRLRRRYSTALDTLLTADDARGGRVGDLVENIFHSRGIHGGGIANGELRDRCTLPAQLPVRARTVERTRRAS